MRLRRFRSIVIVGLILLILIGIWSCSSKIIDNSPIEWESSEDEDIKEKIENSVGVLGEDTQPYSIDEKKNYKGSKLDLSNVDNFILSYNSLVDDVGLDVVVDSAYSNESMQWMNIYSVGNLVITTYQLDDSIKEVAIIGVDKSNDLEVYLSEEYKVLYEEGNTFISSVVYSVE